jgi:hypothetical protein
MQLVYLVPRADRSTLVILRRSRRISIGDERASLCRIWPSRFGGEIPHVVRDDAAHLELGVSLGAVWQSGSIGHSLSRRIEAEQRDAVRACLDKRPVAEAALGPEAQGTAKPWIRRRSHEHVNTHAHAPAFAEFAGFAANP